MPRAAAFSLLLAASLGAAYFFVPSPAPAPAAKATAAASPVSGPDPFLAKLKPALSAKPSAPPSPSRQSDWPALYGPTRDGVVVETDLRLDWPASGPPELWRKTIGVGYSQICVAGDKLLLFHRQGDGEILDCLNASDGAKVWRYEHPTTYVDRYGYNGGPRCTPIVEGEFIYAYGVEGKLVKLKLADGSKLWERDLNVDYEVEQGFFGVGATPWLEGDRLIINVGGKKTKAGIVAVSAADGKSLWTATSHGASYATPYGATIHGKRHVFVFTEDGLTSVDPATGAVYFEVPYRSKLVESVNATSPLVVGDLVLVSATYRTGSLCLRVKPDGTHEEVWRNAKFPDSHFSNLLHVDGFVYGFAGRHEADAELFCIELATGKPRWRNLTRLGRGQILKAGNRFLLWGERGHLAAAEVNSEKLVPLAFTDPDPEKGLLGHPAWTPPAISRGRIYLRNEKTLLCLDLKPKS